MHFDASAPSDLEVLIETGELDGLADLARASRLIDRLARGHLTKYAAVDPALPVPDPGFVLVVDQVRGDASLRHGGATEASFGRMLAAARLEHPGARIVVKVHPESTRGLRPGHFRSGEADRLHLLDAPVSPWSLLAAARAVYTVSSQIGFEAILAGHRPRVFGEPFYAGWGLSDDERTIPRRTRRVDRRQLALAALVRYPVWYDPFRDRLCEVEDVADALEAAARTWREDRAGHVLSGMSPWKRRHLRRYFGTERAPSFIRVPDRAAQAARASGRPLLVWSGKLRQGHRTAPAIRRVEDGFLRSRGLGAALVPPLSLVIDDLGIHHDPSRPSRLEHLIAASDGLTADELARAERLMRTLTASGLSKYNTGAARLPRLPGGHRILVAGQVADDESIRLGASDIATNAGLLARARADNPSAILIYKPHPDVEAGLRPGRISATEADLVLVGADAAASLAAVDELWTISSTLGLEALIRGVPVTCLGAPFYAGWGLTRDLGPVPARRRARPPLAALVHAALIAYPRYLDPVTGLPCPPEVIVERLASERPSSGAAARGLAMPARLGTLSVLRLRTGPATDP